MIYAVRELYEKELAYLGKFISPGMVVVDGGANCGIYTLIASELVGPSGRVFSFEPGTESFSALQKNLELNHLENVTPFRAALADRDGTARLYHAGRGPTSFALGRPEQGSGKWEEVTTRTLGSVLQEMKADQVGLIKLDVEGAEELALQGAQSVIVRSRPTIIFEMNVEAAKNLDLNPLGSWKLLKNLGYRLFSLTESGELLEVNQPPEDDCMNLVAIHREMKK